MNIKTKSVVLAVVLSLAVSGAGTISAGAATKKPAAKPAVKKPAVKKPAAKPAAKPAPSAAITSDLQKEINALNASGGKFTYWIGMIFSDLANAAYQDQIKSWGKSRGIQTDPILVNQNVQAAQVTAAVAAGTLPPAFDASQTLVVQLGEKNLLNVKDIVDSQVKKYGGPNKATESMLDPTWPGLNLGVPYAVGGNIIYRRLDLLKAAGQKTTAPKTWDELMDTAVKTQEKGGAGFNIGLVGDSNDIFRAQFVGYGGRFADAAGKKCTIDTQASRDFLTFVKKWFDKGAYNSGANNNDGAWDNNLYLGGRTVFIANPGSVYATMVNGSASWPKSADLTKMSKNTGFSGLPAGPKSRVAPSGGQLRVIPKTSKYPLLAKDLIQFLAETRNAQEYLETAVYGPVWKSYNVFDFWDENRDPVHGGLFDIATAGTSATFPDVDNNGYAEFVAGFNLPKMVQRYLFDGDSMDKTIAEAQKVCQQLYDK